MIPACAVVFQSRPNPRGSSTSSASRSTSQTPLEELGGPGVGEGLGQLVAPGLVLGLQGAELVDGVGPALRPRPSVLRRPRDRDGADGLAGGAARGRDAAGPWAVRSPGRARRPARRALSREADGARLEGRMATLDTHAIARTLTDAGADPKLADAITAAVREAADHGDHVTPDQFKAGLAELEARLTWRFAGAMLAQTGVILAAVIGAAVAILRMLG